MERVAQRTAVVFLNGFARSGFDKFDLPKSWNAGNIAVVTFLLPVINYKMTDSFHLCDTHVVACSSFPLRRRQREWINIASERGADREEATLETCSPLGGREQAASEEDTMMRNSNDF